MRTLILGLALLLACVPVAAADDGADSSASSETTQTTETSTSSASATSPAFIGPPGCKPNCV